MALFWEIPDKIYLGDLESHVIWCDGLYEKHPITSHVIWRLWAKNCQRFTQ